MYNNQGMKNRFVPKYANEVSMDKKNVLKKTTAVILLLTLLLSVSMLVSCGGNEKGVLSVEGVECTEDMYRY